MIQNLLYDLSQLSLPWDNMDREFVRRPQKWDALGLARFIAVSKALVYSAVQEMVIAELKRNDGRS
jgi:hypothetical protein